MYLRYTKKTIRATPSWTNTTKQKRKGTNTKLKRFTYLERTLD